MSNKKIKVYQPTASTSFMLTGLLVAKPTLPKPMKVAPRSILHDVVMVCKKTPTDIKREKIERRLRRKPRKRIVIST